MRSRSQDSPTSQAWSAGVIAGLAALVLYVATTRSFVSPADPGEFQTMARVGGIAHSGYAPVVLLLQLFGRIPFGTIAFRANLMSCISGAIAVGLAAFAGTRLTGNRIASIVAALSFALARATWKESTEASVHAPTLAMEAVAFLLVVRFTRHPDRRGAFFMGLIGGLAALSHFSAFSLIAVVVAAAAYTIVRGTLQLSHVGLATIGLLVGLLPIGYMLAMDRPDQPMNYIEDVMRPEPAEYFPSGSVPKTRLERATWLLSGRQYLAPPSSAPSHPEGHTYRALSLLAEVTLNEFPLWGLPLALFGALMLWRRRVAGAWLVGVWVIGVFMLTNAVSSGWIAAYFFLPGLWGLTLGMAAGVDALSRAWPRLVPALAGVLLLGTSVLRLSQPNPPAPLGHFNLTRSTWFMWPKDWSPLRTERGWDDFGHEVMKALPPRAAVLVSWEEGNVLRYFRFAEPLRSDVHVVIVGIHPGRVANTVALERAEGRPVFATFAGPSTQIPGLTFMRVGSWPLGGLWHVVETDSAREH
jgi:Protein of unknown function (DUF2723)